MASVRPGLKRQATQHQGTGEADKPTGAKLQTCAQRIAAATVKKAQVVISDVQAQDAEALFRKADSEQTGLLSRGALTEVLREVGLEKALGETFSASARLAFDAHSADSHFLSLAEFKQLYYRVSKWHPGLLPRPTKLTITILSAKDLPPADTNGKSDPYCTCMVSGKPWSKSQTHIDYKTLNPWWGEDLDDRYGYEDEKDSLLFVVWDYDRDGQHEELGRVTLPSKEFHRDGGFDGVMHVETTMKGYKPLIKVRVCVRGLPESPPKLKIEILSSKGLRPADANGKSDPFCIMQLVGKPYSKSQTKIKNATLEPVWNETFDDKHRYEEGDNIEFVVRDYDGKGKAHELLGKVILQGTEFHKPGGFDGNLTLTEAGKGFTPTIHVRVTVRNVEEAAAKAAAEVAAAAAPEAGEGEDEGGEA